MLAEIVGARKEEVACMGTLTANLHALLSSFYRPTGRRYKIMYEAKAFPSDQVRGQRLRLSASLLSVYPIVQYAFASQVEMHDFPDVALMPIEPRAGEYAIRTDDILDMIDQEGESIAIICFAGIQFYSGEFFDMERITRAGRAKVRVQLSTRECTSSSSCRAASLVGTLLMQWATCHSSSASGAPTLPSGARTSTSTPDLAGLLASLCTSAGAIVHGSLAGGDTTE